jgi:chorismate synthase
MLAEIEAARVDNDSVGGIIECAALGVPAGLGDPLFDGLDNRIASAIFGIPAVKSLEFGNGLAATELRGSQNNDAFYFDESGAVRTRTNNSGGILGGISNGMPLIVRVGFKPTPSIAREQESVNLATGESATLVIKGRHDPCIVPRAVPVVEAAVALALYDALLETDQ